MSDDLTRMRNSLTGASLIVTRPSASARAMAVQARARGGCVVCLPGTRLSPAADPDAARAALHAAKNADAWIFTSPASVTYCFDLLGKKSIPGAGKIFAVGAGTSRALQAFGIKALFPAGEQNSAGLLQEPILADPRGWTIALVEAPGGSDQLANTLSERRAQIVRVGVYQRAAPWLSSRRIQWLEQAPRPWISLISSMASLDNLLAALPSTLAMQWRKEILIVSSARLAEYAQSRGFHDIHRAESALDSDLIAAACAALARHRF